MTPELAYLIARLTCHRCNGCGTLTSSVTYNGTPHVTYRPCDICHGTGIAEQCT